MSLSVFAECYGERNCPGEQWASGLAGKGKRMELHAEREISTIGRLNRFNATKFEGRF
jgi:hypothetical protein